MTAAHSDVAPVPEPVRRIPGRDAVRALIRAALETQDDRTGNAAGRSSGCAGDVGGLADDTTAAVVRAMTTGLSDGDAGELAGILLRQSLGDDGWRAFRDALAVGMETTDGSSGDDSAYPPATWAKVDLAIRWWGE